MMWLRKLHVPGASPASVRPSRPTATAQIVNKSRVGQRKGRSGQQTRSALLRIVFVFAPFLFKAFDEILLHGGVEAGEEGFVETMDADQVHHVAKILVAP